MKKGLYRRLGLCWGETGTVEKKMETIGVVGITYFYMGGCQNYGPFWDAHYTMAANIWGTQKGTIILTATPMSHNLNSLKMGYIGEFLCMRSRVQG